MLKSYCFKSVVLFPDGQVIAFSEASLNDHANKKQDWHVNKYCAVVRFVDFFYRANT